MTCLSNALLLTRATGIRIGECIHLALDCLRSLGQNQWALHVPLGKLYTERLVPVDEDVRHIVTRILTLRALAPSSQLAEIRRLAVAALWELSAPCISTLRNALHQAAERAAAPIVSPATSFRHTYATEMVRLGVSLPALMQLLGHKDIRMTLRYVQVTQQDLQREFHLARQNAITASPRSQTFLARLPSVSQLRSPRHPPRPGRNSPSPGNVSPPASR